MQYNVIFDISNFTYPWLKSNIFEIIIIVGIVLLYFIASKYLKDFIEIKLSFIAMFIIVIIAGSLFFNYFENLLYQSVKAEYLNKQCKIIEGYVENVSVSYGRMPTQRFSVKNVNFEISDNISSGGYNITIMNGGKIRLNEYIRLHYIERSNNERIIAKLEIRK